jgi:hypothetical protein
VRQIRWLMLHRRAQSKTLMDLRKVIFGTITKYRQFNLELVVNQPPYELKRFLFGNPNLSGRFWLVLEGESDAVRQIINCLRFYNSALCSI